MTISTRRAGEYLSLQKTLMKTLDRSFVTWGGGAALAGAVLLGAPSAQADPTDSKRAGSGIAPDAEDLDAQPPAGGAAPKPDKVRTGNWSLMADTQLQSIQFSDLSTSFGFGVGYRSVYTDSLAIIRKGTVATLEGNALASDYGHFVLDPAAANVGATGRFMYFANSGKRCKVDCSATDPVYTGLQLGLIVAVNVGQTKTRATLPDGTLIEENLVGGSALAGGVVRVSGTITGDVERPVALGAYFGLAPHVVGGDMTAQQRKDVLGDRSSVYFGIEGGLFFQLASAYVTMRMSQIWPNDNPVKGLTGFQLIPSIVFSLPFDIVSYEPKQDDKKGTPDTSQPPAAPAASSGAAPAGSAPPAPAAPPATSTQAPGAASASPVAPAEAPH